MLPRLLAARAPVGALHQSRQEPFHLRHVLEESTGRFHIFPGSDGACGELYCELLQPLIVLAEEILEHTQHRLGILRGRGQRRKRHGGGGRRRRHVRELRASGRGPRGPDCRLSFESRRYRGRRDRRGRRRCRPRVASVHRVRYLRHGGGLHRLSRAIFRRCPGGPAHQGFGMGQSLASPQAVIRALDQAGHVKHEVALFGSGEEGRAPIDIFTGGGGTGSEVHRVSLEDFVGLISQEGLEPAQLFLGLGRSRGHLFQRRRDGGLLSRLQVRKGLAGRRENRGDILFLHLQEVVGGQRGGTRGRDARIFTIAPRLWREGRFWGRRDLRFLCSLGSRSQGAGVGQSFAAAEPVVRALDQTGQEPKKLTAAGGWPSRKEGGTSVHVLARGGGAGSEVHRMSLESFVGLVSQVRLELAQLFFGRGRSWGRLLGRSGWGVRRGSGEVRKGFRRCRRGLWSPLLKPWWDIRRRDGRGGNGGVSVILPIVVGGRVHGVGGSRRPFLRVSCLFQKLSGGFLRRQGRGVGQGLLPPQAVVCALDQTGHVEHEVSLAPRRPSRKEGGALVHILACGRGSCGEVHRVSLQDFVDFVP
mmetsp:Transcript_39977/g.93844  ORF Transcript_39977/g.93844 Transcript_39977/m.93844 type:complete len:587 (-) Transcript_39977:703-2463(-)